MAATKPYTYNSISYTTCLVIIYASLLICERIISLNIADLIYAVYLSSANYEIQDGHHKKYTFDYIQYNMIVEYSWFYVDPPLYQQFNLLHAYDKNIYIFKLHKWWKSRWPPQNLHI